jgi:hypothetical protein
VIYFWALAIIIINVDAVFALLTAQPIKIHGKNCIYVVLNFYEKKLGIFYAFFSLLRFCKIFINFSL